MARITCDFYANSLGLSSSVSVLIPEPAQASEDFCQRLAEGRLKTLWLLHGLSDDHTSWLRNTSLERYANSLELAIVMPAVGRSFYQNMAHGLPYADYLRKELTERLPLLFPLSTAMEDNYVAGISMGGYGAFHWALLEPARFAAAASLSGVLDLAERIRTIDQQPGIKLPEVADIVGDPDAVEGSDYDLLYLLEQHTQQSTELPFLYQCCGASDYLYHINQRFRQHAERLGAPLTYKESPGGHSWDYWDREIPRVLAWLLE